MSNRNGEKARTSIKRKVRLQRRKRTRELKKHLASLNQPESQNKAVKSEGNKEA